MSRFVRLCLPVVCFAAAGPAYAAEIQIAVQNPVVELTVNEVVQSEPDTATVGAGVTVRAPTASEALRMNAAQMDKVIARLRTLGIKREDIQTSNFSLNAQYRYNNEGQMPTFIGYDAANQVTVTLRRLDRIGETLDALVLAGANNVFGPNFTLQNDAAVKAAGRERAFANARKQAEKYAAMAGFSNLRLLEISETYSAAVPMPMGNSIVVTASAKGEATPVELGTVGTGVTVTVKYEMVR